MDEITREAVLAPENTEKLKEFFDDYNAEFDGVEREYTVIGYYEDDHGVWVEHVKATSVAQAMQIAVVNMEDYDDWQPCTIRNVVGVFVGHHKEVSSLETVLDGGIIVDPDSCG
jgi:hypothetical protein